MTTVKKSILLGMEVNKMARELKSQISFEGNKIIFNSYEAQCLYNELGEKILKYVMRQAKTYKALYEPKAQIEFDADILVSIGMCEGLNKAFKSWDVTKVDFLASLRKNLRWAFLDYMKEELTDRRKTTYNTSSYTITDDEGNETDYINTLPDENSYTNPIDDKIMIETLTNKLTSEEQNLLAVLMEFTGKSRGQAVAKFFNKPTYDSALRKKVQRFQEKCAKLITA